MSMKTSNLLIGLLRPHFKPKCKILVSLCDKTASPPSPALSFFFWNLCLALQPLVLLSSDWDAEHDPSPSGGARSIVVLDILALAGAVPVVSLFDEGTRGLVSATPSLSLKRENPYIMPLIIGNTMLSVI